LDLVRVVALEVCPDNPFQTRSRTLETQLLRKRLDQAVLKYRERRGVCAVGIDGRI